MLSVKFPQFRMFAKNIKGTVYGNNKPGKTVEKSSLDNISFDKFNKRMEYHRKESGFFPLFKEDLERCIRISLNSIYLG